MAKTIAELQHDVIHIYGAYETTGTNQWSYQTALVDLQYQLGMLSKRILQLQGDRFNEGNSVKQLREAIGDEMADILAEVLFIASSLDVDVEAAWEAMLLSDNEKVLHRSQTRTCLLKLTERTAG